MILALHQQWCAWIGIFILHETNDINHFVNIWPVSWNFGASLDNDVDDNDDEWWWRIVRNLILIDNVHVKGDVGSFITSI